TLIIAWAYLVWCQAMLIWIADLRHDNIWWLARSRQGWQWLALAIVLFGLIAPFFLLLFRAVKKGTGSLGAVAAIVLAAQLAFVAYQVLPEYSRSVSKPAWISTLVVIGVGGIWSAAFLWLLATRPLMPLGDRNWEHACHLLHLEHEELEREEAL